MKALRTVVVVTALMCTLDCAQGQIVPGFMQRFVIAEASARDGETFDLPPQNSASVFDTSLFQTSVANAASVASAVGSSTASQLSEILSYAITVTGRVAATATVNTNLDESAGGIAQSVADLNFDLPTLHACSIAGALSGSVSNGTLLGQIVLRDNTGSNWFVRSLPATPDEFAKTNILPAGTCRLFSEFRLGTVAFLEKVRRWAGKGTKEQPQRKMLERGVAIGTIVKMVEDERGESWEAFSNRHGDWGRDLAIYLARKRSGLTLREIGKAMGGLDYKTAGRAAERFEASLADNRKRRRLANALLDQFSLVET